MSEEHTKKSWFSVDESQEAQSADSPHAPLGADQRRDAVPLLTLAFGWGFWSRVFWSAVRSAPACIFPI